MPSKKTLFQQGIAATSVTFCLELTYVCPICQAQFDIAALGCGELTAEHVPPAFRGGKRIILTCRACNNAAGHGVDAEAARRDEAAQFERVTRHGKPGKAGRLTLTCGNQPLTIDASVGEDGVTELKIVGSAKRAIDGQWLREYCSKSWVARLGLSPPKAVGYGPSASYADLC